MEQHHEQNNIYIFVGCYILMITNCVMENWVLATFPHKEYGFIPLGFEGDSTLYKSTRQLKHYAESVMKRWTLVPKFPK